MITYLNLVGTFLVLGSYDSTTPIVNTFVRLGNGFEKNSGANYEPVSFNKITLQLRDYEKWCAFIMEVIIISMFWFSDVGLESTLLIYLNSFWLNVSLINRDCSCFFGHLFAFLVYLRCKCDSVHDMQLLLSHLLSNFPFFLFLPTQHWIDKFFICSRIVYLFIHHFNLSIYFLLLSLDLLCFMHLYFFFLLFNDFLISFMNRLIITD